MDAAVLDEDLVEFVADGVFEADELEEVVLAGILFIFRGFGARDGDAGRFEGGLDVGDGQLELIRFGELDLGGSRIAC